MAKSDLKNLNKEDLDKKLLELKKELMKANAQRSSGSSLKNPGQLRETKKGIARILTLINKKTQGEQKE